MTKTIAVVGFGPGISKAVAEKFGAEGFSVALLARSADKLAEGVSGLKAKGIKAAAFPADAGNPDAIRAALAKVHDELGPITVVHWNAYGGHGIDNLLTADPAQISGAFDVAVVGLLAAVQQALPDLKGDGALLVTNGAFGEINPQIDAFALQLKATGVALGNAAKNKLVGLLAQSLKPEGVYVGQVTVAGMVRGTAYAPEDGIEPSSIANEFWQLYRGRDEIYARVS